MSNEEYRNRVKSVKDVPDFSNCPNVKRHTEFVKDFLRKHPFPDIVENNGSFDYIESSSNPINESEKVQ